MYYLFMFIYLHIKSKSHSNLARQLANIYKPSYSILNIIIISIAKIKFIIIIL